MKIFKTTMLAAILIATIGAFAASAQKVKGGTKIECDTQDIVCARVGGVEVYGKATIIVTPD